MAGILSVTVVAWVVAMIAAWAVNYTDRTPGTVFDYTIPFTRRDAAFIVGGPVSIVARMLRLL